MNINFYYGNMKMTARSAHSLRQKKKKTVVNYKFINKKNLKNSLEVNIEIIIFENIKSD